MREASAVQYLLFPHTVNYCSRCLTRQRPSCPESQGYLHVHSPPRSDEADKLRGGGCWDRRYKPCREIGVRDGDCGWQNETEE